MSKKDGGQAFPSSAYLGMTIRDYFAGQALLIHQAASLWPSPSKEYVAAFCYAMADAMLAERAKE